MTRLDWVVARLGTGWERIAGIALGLLSEEVGFFFLGAMLGVWHWLCVSCLQGTAREKGNLVSQQ